MSMRIAASACHVAHVRSLPRGSARRGLRARARCGSSCRQLLLGGLRFAHVVLVIVAMRRSRSAVARSRAALSLALVALCAETAACAQAAVKNFGVLWATDHSGRNQFRDRLDVG
jgi:hypothetical protein